MSSLPPSLPAAEAEPLGASLGCFGEGREMQCWLCETKSTQRGFPTGEPFAKTNKYLQRKFLLARYLTKWAVSFLSGLEGGEDGWRAFSRAGPL